jgi:hypothetical protein
MRRSRSRSRSSAGASTSSARPSRSSSGRVMTGYWYRFPDSRTRSGSRKFSGRPPSLPSRWSIPRVPVQQAVEGRPPAGSTSCIRRTIHPCRISSRIGLSYRARISSMRRRPSTSAPTSLSCPSASTIKGATRFGQTTQQNVGRLFAIILDNQVISAPQIREPILGGSGQISGSFTAAERQRPRRAAARRRAAGRPDDRRRAHRGSEPWRGFHRGRHLRHAGRRGAGLRLHARWSTASSAPWRTSVWPPT